MAVLVVRGPERSRGMSEEEGGWYRGCVDGLLQLRWQTRDCETGQEVWTCGISEAETGTAPANEWLLGGLDDIFRTRSDGASDWRVPVQYGGLYVEARRTHIQTRLFSSIRL